MMKIIWERYKDIITYLFYGVCTTFINIVVYWILSYFFDVMVSTIGAWIVAVVFAYITNRRNVFKSKANSRGDIVREVTSFFACRIGTGIIDLLIMILFVNVLCFNDVLIKTLSNILVIILNYVASKYVIFKYKD